VPAGKPPVYFIDSMNEELGRKMLKGLGSGGLVAGNVSENFRKYAKKNRLKKTGVNERLITVSEQKALAGKGAFRFRHDPSLVGDMRCVKAEDEIKVIKKAARETVKIWKEIRKNIETGMTEKDVADMINVLIRALGHENSFQPIVAVAENTAYPHAVPGGRRLKKGEHLLADFGLRVRGYCSDLTRIYAKGRINRKITGLLELVREAHDMAIKMVRPGVSTGHLNKAVIRYFNNNKVSSYVLHSLGHGVGRDIHERPFFREGSGERLREGMVIAIEPGLYVPGLGGVREEDMVLVTRNGCEVLTR
jgi:Xaa-Pro aminopeptidase